MEAHSAQRPVHLAQDEGQVRLGCQFELSGNRPLKATDLLHVASRFEVSFEVSFEGNQTRVGNETLPGCSASPLMGTATSLSDTEARGNKPFS